MSCPLSRGSFDLTRGFDTNGYRLPVRNVNEGLIVNMANFAFDPVKLKFPQSVVPSCALCPVTPQGLAPCCLHGFSNCFATGDVCQPLC